MAFTTRKSLLARVRAGDEVSWTDFYETYKPLILLIGSDCLLTQDEKEELVQLVMLEIFKKDIIGKYHESQIPDDVTFKYDPAKGRFRHFFRGIVRNQAYKLCRKRDKGQNVSEENVNLEGLLSENLWDQVWDEEWKKHVLNMALRELRLQTSPEIYLAFEMYAVQGRPVKEVTDFLEISVSALYTAKSRCMDKLKEIIVNLEEK